MFLLCKNIIFFFGERSSSFSLSLLVKYPSLIQNYISWAKFCLILLNETCIRYVILYCIFECCHNLVLLYLYFIILHYYFDLSYFRSIPMFTLKQSFLAFFCLQRLPTKFIMHSLSSIKVLSANCQWLCSIDKRTDVLSFLKEIKASVVCLQDTHLTNKDLNSVKRIWYECYLHGTKRTHGVAILLNNNFEYHVHETNKDMEGNYIQLSLTCGSIKINLINLYAPNSDDPNFFSEIDKLTTYEDADYVVMCRDFNLVLNPSKDSQNHVNINNPESRSKVIALLSERIS